MLSGFREHGRTVFKIHNELEKKNRMILRSLHDSIPKNLLMTDEFDDVIM